MSQEGKRRLFKLSKPSLIKKLRILMPRLDSLSRRFRLREPKRPPLWPFRASLRTRFLLKRENSEPLR